MACEELVARGYRSLRGVRLPLGPINVIVGPNGCGKTNLYRCLYLMHAAAAGRLARVLAEEGGMPSVLWAGDRKKGPVRMSIEVAIPPLRFSLACGLPIPPARFKLDPLVKEERLTVDDGGTAVSLLERNGPSAFVRDADGNRVTYPMTIRDAESILSQVVDTGRYPTLGFARAELLAWRFYHGFRTDAASPLRHPQVGVQTPVLDHDGADLAAALLTISDIGDGGALRAAVDAAFPGARLHIDENDARFEVSLETRGLHRPLRAAELSDGTLRYLCLLAALLSPRPPPMLALNEPETSLHPDLLEPLGELLVAAARSSQLCVTTHSEPLAAAVARRSKAAPIRLEITGGETRVVKQPEA